MASIGLENLQDHLNCSICLDTYINPKQLQCHHVYCQQCLVKLVSRDKEDQLSLACPSCRHITPVPPSGVRDLQAAFHINQLLEIVERHKKAEVSTIGIESETFSGFTPHERIMPTIGCPEHDERSLELFCETCVETICFKCIKKGEKHHSHDYDELNEAFEKYKREITASLEPMERQLKGIEKALSELNVCCNEISIKQDLIKVDISDSIAQLHETLDIRKTELICQLDQLTQDKIRRLETQRDQLETNQAQLSSYLQFMKENLRTSNQTEALLTKSTTVKQVKELTSTFQMDTLEPNAKADMIFSALEDLITECQRYGEVCVAGSPDPTKCLVTGKGLGTAAVGKESTVVLQTFKSNSQPCEESKASVSCELISEIAGTKARCSILQIGQSTYEISYQPTIKGRHQLHIKVEGRHIRSSPHVVGARLPVRKLGTPILTIEGVRKPMGVAVNQSGEVVVTEWSGHCVTVFSPSGERLRTFGSRGSSQGQFQFPYGVAVDSEDNILVIDCSNHRVQKFTSQGEFIRAVGTKGSGPLQFDYPHGIAFNACNGKVYVGSRNGCIQILNSDLSYFGTFGTRGSGKGQFAEPQLIACDSSGKVYVADFGNHRVQVFTPEGEFYWMFGRHGTGRGELKEPWGIAVDSDGRIYISEQWNNRVSVFNPKGIFLKQFGSEGEKTGQFVFPQGLAVDDSGVVYVCDHNNKRVQLF